MDNVALKLKAQSYKDKLRSTSVKKQAYTDLIKQVQALKKEKAEAMNELSAHLAALNPMFEMVISKAMLIKENTAVQLKDVTAKYLKEQTQRKLLYNTVQELRGNIR